MAKRKRKITRSKKKVTKRKKKTKKSKRVVNYWADAQWVEERIQSRGYNSLRAFSLDLGRDPTIAFKVLTGLRELSINEAEVWAEYLGVTLEALLKAYGVKYFTPRK
jgi:hypothetical protein